MTNILFRSGVDFGEEEKICREVFGDQVKRLRSECDPNSLVIPRYSALPYYQELEKDLQNNGCRLANTYRQHQWIANFEWYEDLKAYTFETYDDYTFPSAPEGAYVVKGRTNSRKHEWSTKMFAENKRRASVIAAELMTDPLIGPQGVIYRKYQPLRTFEVGLNGLPFTNEWRFFFYKRSAISFGYYWSNSDQVPDILDQTEFMKFFDISTLACKVSYIASQHADFYVIDIAEKENGEPVLVEINDGSMSGLSTIDPLRFYTNLKKALEE